MAKKYVLGASAARKFRELMNEGEGVSSRSLIGGAKFAVKMPAPFAVQWAASLNEGVGRWIIYLPSRSLIYYQGHAIDCIKDLESAGGDYPIGWYTLGESFTAEATGIWLNVNSGDFYPNAMIGLVQVAAISNKRVTQMVSSTIFMAGAAPRPFEYSDGVVSAGDIPCPRDTVHAESYVIQNQTTFVYLHIDLVNNYYSATINEVSREQTTTHVQYLLYRIENGAVSLDSRPSIIPAMEIV